MRFLPVALLFCTATLGEVVAARYGFMPPITVLFAFCLAMRVGAWRALLPAILAAACTDALWCHAFPSRMTAVILATLTANAWRNWGDVHAFGGIAISVVACGTASWLGSALETPLAGLSFVGWKMLLTQLLWCLPMLPIVATIFDACFQRQLAWYSILAAESPEEDAADD